MSGVLGSFDRLAAIYAWLEYLAFGRALEAARFWHLEYLAGCSRVLVLGEGDGRFLNRLLKMYPTLRVDCVDASGAMLARARQRLASEALARVNFRQEDALLAAFGKGEYDAVVTLFFLDCFSPEEVSGLVDRIKPALRKNPRWFWTDFVLPNRGWRRWRAQLWLQGMYFFFRTQTTITARELPPSERVLSKAGFIRRAELTFQGEMVRSVVWEKGA